jgi:hypothetical protein
MTQEETDRVHRAECRNTDERRVGPPIAGRPAADREEVSAVARRDKEIH